MSAEIPHDLSELCRRVGVEPGFWDVRGHWVAAGAEPLCAVLRALGHDVAEPAAAGAALAAHDHAIWAELTPPVAIAHGDAGATIGLRVPSGAGGQISITLQLEDGARQAHDVRLETLAVTFVADLAGEHMLERRLELPRLPLGYHRAAIEVHGKRGETLVVQAPERCHAPPGSACGFGLFAPLYALGRERGAAIGDLGDLARLARDTRTLGGDVIGTLPLLAASYAPSHLAEVSPYSPVSRRYWNELYLDLDALAAELDAPGADRLRAELEGGALAATWRELGRTGSVDYDRVALIERRTLEVLARRGWAQPATRAALEAELVRRPGLDDYARFRAAVERTGQRWGAWPAAARDGDLAGLEHEAARRYHVFAQWAMARQLARLKSAAEHGGAAGLYLDLPVGSSSDGYDLWRERDVFAPAVATGAPPDPLQWAGQNWALPPLSPVASRRTGHRYFVECIRSHAEAAAMLRIDHVMGLHRLYWIPDGRPASDGVYVRYPADELWAIVALESARNHCAIVGEDLGTVPEEVRPTMAARGAHRLFVAQFDWARREDGPHPNPAPAGSVAGLDTHDTRTFARFVEEEGLGDPAALLAPWLVELGEGDADIVLVAIEDLWLERDPQNVPGTTDAQHANWRQRLAHAPAAALAEPAASAALRALIDARKSAAARRDPSTP